MVRRFHGRELPADGVRLAPLVVAMRIPLGVIAYFGAIGLAMRLPQPIQDTAVGYLIIPIILAVFAGVCAGLVRGMAAVDAKWRNSDHELIQALRSVLYRPRRQRGTGIIHQTIHMLLISPINSD
jgi:hypothetical protein